MWGTTALAGVIVLASVGFAVVWNHLNGNIRTQDAGLKPSPIDGKQDILFIGSDSRAGANQTLGGGNVAGARSDTAMVFDSPADRRKGTEVSIPRDSMVQIPDCVGTNGQTVAAYYGMFNSAFTNGGAPCTVQTVESLTSLPLTHYIVVDFEGVVGVVNALGGVKVCVTQPISDPDSGLNIPAGTTTLNGQQALAFVRVRHSVGDGSDLQRIQRQQYFLDQLSSQVRADGLLTDPVKLYNVLNAATSAIQTDPGLGSVSDLYGLAQTLNSIPSGKMTYVTVPNEPYPDDPNRVIWSEPAATALWNSLISEPDSASASATSAALGARSGLGTQSGLGARSGLGSLSGPGTRSGLGARSGLGTRSGLGGNGVLAGGARAANGGGLGFRTPLSGVPGIGPGMPSIAGPANAGDTGNATASAAQSLGAFESVMRLALMADTPTDTSGTSGTSGTSSGAADGSSIGTTNPGGIDTCAAN